MISGKPLIAKFLNLFFMEKKKNVQPQQKNKKPGNTNGNSGNNNKTADQQSRQLPNQDPHEKVEEKSFERDPGGQINPGMGKRAVINQDEHIINEEEKIEEDQIF